nr:unnamed protein product [Callosobruchus analis]
MGQRYTGELFSAYSTPPLPARQREGEENRTTYRAESYISGHHEGHQSTMPEKNSEKAEISLTIYHQNMQCLKNKTEMIEIELAKYKADIFCVSEHWLNEDQVQACTIQGYQPASMYYRSCCKNGGVGIFCRNELGKYITEIDVIKSVNEKTFEICGIELKTYKQKVHIFCLYRTPSSDFKTFIEIFSSFLENRYKHKSTRSVILVGDWNVDFSSNSLEKNLLQDTLSSFGFQNIVDEATRVSLTSATAIDYVCLNVEQSDSCQLLTLHSCINIGICESSYSRSFSKTNYKYFIESLQKENWEDVYTTRNVNEGFKTFLDIIRCYADDSFPLKKVQTKKRHNKPWLTTGITISGQRLKYLHDKGVLAMNTTPVIRRHTVRQLLQPKNCIMIIYTKIPQTKVKLRGILLRNPAIKTKDRK